MDKALTFRYILEFVEEHPETIDLPIRVMQEHLIEKPGITQVESDLTDIASNQSNVILIGQELLIPESELKDVPDTARTETLSDLPRNKET